jgi:hypothetical protein
MKKSNRWFQQNSKRQTARNVANLPTVIRTGPTAHLIPDRRENDQGDSYFVVGKSRVGDGAVVR